MNFGSHVDGIVAVAAALVNVATPGEMQGRPFVVPSAGELFEPLAAAVALGQRTSRPPARAHLPQLVELARTARPVFQLVDAADVAGGARAANALLDRYRPTPLLEQHDGEPWHLHFHGPKGSDPTGWGGAVAMGLATVLGSEYADRLGVCAAPVCDRVFVDVSRNGNRRFCSETCQNRVKAAAHRARQRG